jgi:hypothetical protein
MRKRKRVRPSSISHIIIESRHPATMKSVPGQNVQLEYCADLRCFYYFPGPTHEAAITAGAKTKTRAKRRKQR